VWPHRFKTHAVFDWADTEVVDLDGNTPLILAGFGGHGDVAKVLLKHHAKYDASNRCVPSQRPLHAVIQYSHVLIHSPQQFVQPHRQQNLVLSRNLSFHEKVLQMQ
jgi:ankyrin repeat protein